MVLLRRTRLLTHFGIIAYEFLTAFADRNPQVKAWLGAFRKLGMPRVFPVARLADLNRPFAALRVPFTVQNFPLAYARAEKRRHTALSRMLLDAGHGGGEAGTTTLDTQSP